MIAEPILAPIFGRERPRLAPPEPARTLAAEFREIALELGIDLYPSQDVAARYLYALDASDRWLYPEVADIVARQNGKTEILVPHITKRLKMGRRIMHTAQNRELPREVFGRVADVFETKYPRELLKAPRFANGQEEILLRNGGTYRIVAPTRGGARGPSNDDLIVDELREMETHDFVAAAKPTLTASANPQILWLSNAGTETSVVLNALKARSLADPSLAYLEWSAAPERSADDRLGWLEANPSIGHHESTMRNLEREYLANKLAGTMAIFETEHLCRWVATLRERLVGEADWANCGLEPPMETPLRPVMAVSLDPQGTRASAVLAWPRSDGTIGLRVLFDVPGNPIDTDRLGKDLRATARKWGVTTVGYDPLTDAVLAKFFRRTESISGGKYANASSRFVTVVEADKLRWDDAAAVGDDLAWTAKKPHDESGSFQAVRADDDRPITAALAAIRAVWLASVPRPEPVPSAPSVAGF